MPAVCPAAGDPARATSLAALELPLAQEGDLYLVVDPARRVIEIKARGIALDSVPFSGVAFLRYRPARRASPAPAFELPAVFTVEEDPEAAHRRLLAPAELVPYTEESGDAAPPPAAALEQAPLPEPPGAYRVRLEGGWELEVGADTRAAGLLGRIGQTLRHGWAQLRGRPLEPPALVALALDPDDGRRLHHLFRRGTRILVAGASAVDAGRES